MSDEAELLRTILDEIRALRRDLHLPPRGATDDPARLLDAIARHTGAPFTTRELVEAAVLPDNAALRAALGATNAKRLGKLLHRIEGQPHGGYEVHRIADDRDGLLWRVLPAKAP